MRSYFLFSSLSFCHKTYVICKIYLDAMIKGLQIKYLQAFFPYFRYFRIQGIINPTFISCIGASTFTKSK